LKIQSGNRELRLWIIGTTQLAHCLLFTLSHFWGALHYPLLSSGPILACEIPREFDYPAGSKASVQIGMLSP
jgi:hypothetical protein